jgi:hypothetical protein
MGAPEVSNGCCLAEYPTGRGLIPTPFLGLGEADADVPSAGRVAPSGQGVVAAEGWVTKDAVPPSAAVVVVSPE